MPALALKWRCKCVGSSAAAHFLVLVRENFTLLEQDSTSYSSNYHQPKKHQK